MATIADMLREESRAGSAGLLQEDEGTRVRLKEAASSADALSEGKVALAERKPLLSSDSKRARLSASERRAAGMLSRRERRRTWAKRKAAIASSEAWRVARSGMEDGQGDDAPSAFKAKKGKARRTKRALGALIAKAAAKRRAASAAATGAEAATAATARVATAAPEAAAGAAQAIAAGGSGAMALVSLGLVLALSIGAAAGAAEGLADTWGLEGLNDSERIVALYLRGKGLDKVHVASVMGNIEAECGFDAGAIEAGNGIGLGLCQWSFGRRSSLEAYAASLGLPPSDIHVQLDWLWAEYSGSADGLKGDPMAHGASYQWGWNYESGCSSFLASSGIGRFPGASHTGFENTSSIPVATEYFLWGWERAATATAHVDRRIESANRYYGIFNSGKGGSGGGARKAKGSLQWPLDTPTWTTYANHSGLDLPAPMGSGVYASDAGVVVYVQHWTSSMGTGGAAAWGNYVQVYHPASKTITGYAHLSAIYASVGQQVSRGQQVGEVGSTGNSTGPHLHYEIYEGASQTAHSGSRIPGTPAAFSRWFEL